MAAKNFSVFVNIGGRVAPSFTGAINTVEGRLDGLSRRMRARAAEAKAAMRGIADSFKSAAALAAGGGIAFSFKHALGDGAELAHEIQGMRNAGRTAHEVAEGITAATEAISKLPTSTLTNGIKLLNETTGAFGDYHHALENLTFNSKLADVLKNTVHVEDPTHALGSMIKALEIRGSASNPETYRREAEKLTQAMTFFGGRLKPEDIYTFASNAQVGIRQLNERFLTRIAPSMIQELGGDKVGTGLTAFRTIISGRKISDNAQAKSWVELGLLDKSKLIHNKMGDVKGWKEGAVKNTEGAYRDPLQFMEDTILPALQSKWKVDTSDPIKLGAALNTLFKNSKANAFVAAVSTVIDRARLKKDEALINKVLSVDENYDSSLLNDPKFAQTAIKSSLTNIGAALTLPMMKPIAQMLVALARGINQVSAALMRNPQAAKIVAGLAAALTTLAAVRIASFVLGIAGLGRALLFLTLAAPLGLAARLVGVANAIRVLAVASALGAVGRLRALAAGIIALGAVGGVRGVLAAMAGSFVALGRAILMLPVTLLRGAFVGLAAIFSPVGIAVAAITVALTALGVWVYNNLGGIGTFFTSFGDAFTKALGPEAGQNVEKVVGWLKQAWTWVSNLLGPIDETGKKWKAWGEWAGEGAAAVVTALSGLPEKIGQLAKQGYDALVNFDWTAAGSALVGRIVAGVRSAAGSFVGAIGDLARRAIGSLGGGEAPSTGGGAGPSGPAVAGARAAGGPVTGGRPYLVGEKGPEIFVPNGSGRIETNGVLNGLSKAGGRAGDGKGLTVGVDASAIEEAGKTAKKAGETITASLDTTTKPIVDTSSIEAATAAAEKLKAVLASVGAGNISLGGQGGAGGGGAGGGLGGGAAAAGSFGGKALGVGDGAGIGHTASKAERAAYIRQAAIARGINPEVALRVAQSEGFNKYTGDQGRSFGDWQLFTGGGVGNRALKAGINVRDPSTWKRQTDFALDVAKREGWSQWHGARKVGIGNRTGLNYAPAAAAKAGAEKPSAAENAVKLSGARATGGPVADGLSYLVGERGPEIFTPGASGQISTNGTLNRLAELGRMAVEGTGEGVAPTPGMVARLRPQGGNVSTRGDTHYAPQFHIHDAHDPVAVRKQVEDKFWDLIHRAESDQRGSLSD